ncbi:hypothetical protein LCGC14_0686890 [marine sediment metagenome]|uniref:DUF3987 domain-containing protein n=1 Tax=marine sediment metagenome TaxID=412755 RepID=A0A0F9QRD0_9ZZZZ
MSNGNHKNGTSPTGDGRHVDDWLTNYLEYTSDQESPSLFHLWVGLSVLASALGRGVWVNRGYYTLYPNLYVVLIGASARVRKTSAIRIGYELFRDALPNHVLVSQKTTPEALISIFVEQYKERKISGGSIVSDELGVFLGGAGKSSDTIQLLTKWYDCPSHFEYHTMMRGKEVMNNVYCNLMAGTTPQWLKDSMPKHAVGGGFTSRVIFCYQTTPEHLEPWPELTPALVKLKCKLVKDLRIIAKVGGEYKVTEEAREWYSDWYTSVFRPERTPNVSLDGYFGRKHDTLLKLAMLFSVSKSNNKVVSEVEMRMALKALNQNEKYLLQTLQLIQMTEVGEESEKVFRVIERRGRIDHVSLMRQVSYCINARRLEEVIGDLMMCEKVEQVTDKGNRYYRVKSSKFNN